jgi:polyisoprenoid-binding protein YceI
MRLSRFSFVAAALAAGFLASTAASVRADAYTVDPVHSNTVFHIHHFNAGFVWGLIPNPTGTVNYDAANPDGINFVVSVDISKIFTGNEKRDSDLKGPDWFNVKQFPTMDFKSTAVKKTGDNTYDVTGDLSIHGVTKSVTVPMTMTGIGKGMRGESRLGFEGEFTINRNDFDMKTLPGAVGDDVVIDVALESTQQ